MSIRSAISGFFNRPPRPGPTYSEQATIEAYASAATAIASYRLGKPTWPDRDPATFDVKAYRLVSLIFRCVNLISHAAGVAKVRVYDEAKRDEAIDDHPLRRLMRQPNPIMGEAIFWANVAMRTAVAGFCVVEKERNRLGEVIALWPLTSSWLRAVPRSDSRFDWEYRIPGIQQPFTIKAEDAVPFRWADTPDGSAYGVGPVAIGMRSAALITKMVDFLGVLFERGGVPLVGLIPDLMPGQRLDQAATDAMLARFIERHGGIERSAIPMVMAGIKEAVRLGFDMDELAYTDLRDVSELEIVQAFGVPPTKAMIRVGLEHSDSRANAEVDDATFYRDTMVPLWTRFDDALTTSLLPDFEPPGSRISLEFDVSDVAALQPDRNARAPWLIQGFAASAFSQHTVHRELGLPLPDTDDFYVRGLAVEAIPADDPLGLQTPPPPPPPPADANALARLGRVTIREVAAGSGPARRYAQAASNRERIATVAEQRYPSLKAFFLAQGTRVAAAAEAIAPVELVGANGHGRERYAVELLPLDWAEEERRLAQALRPLHVLAGTSAFQAASDQIGVEMSFDLANPRILDVVDRLAAREKGPVGMTAETKTTVDRLITDGLNEGRSIADITKSLTDKFGEMSEGRAQVIARTEAMVGFGEGSALAYKESGVVDRAQIFDNPEHTENYGASDGLTCAQRNKIVVPIDEAASHIHADHPNGSAAMAPILIGEE